MTMCIGDLQGCGISIG